jgi:hypothetical protein
LPLRTRRVSGFISEPIVDLLYVPAFEVQVYLPVIYYEQEGSLDAKRMIIEV